MSTTISQKYDIAFAFDTTGSMNGCISQVKRNIETIVRDLFAKIPGVRIALIAFEDYDFSYVWKAIDFTTDESALIHFMQNMGSAHCVTGRDLGFRGGRGDEGIHECYEYVLHRVPGLNWSSDSARSLVMIGDAPPHSPANAYNGLDWRAELLRVKEAGINIYSVQCLSWGNRPNIKEFFKTIAQETQGYHLYLDQFTMIPWMMMAICFRQMGGDRLERFEAELGAGAGVSGGLKQVFDIMLGKRTTEEVEAENDAKYDYSHSSSSSSSSTTNYALLGVRPSRSRSQKATTTGLEGTRVEDAEMKPSPPSRFQVLSVDRDLDIKEFASENGISFQPGRGFYLFNKPELIQKRKEVILREKSTGNFYEGAKARFMLNLVDYDDSKRIKPTEFAEYDVFIQSTSANRKLIGGTTFLYDTM